MLALISRSHSWATPRLPLKTVAMEIYAGNQFKSYEKRTLDWAILSGEVSPKSADAVPELSKRLIHIVKVSTHST